MLLLGFSDYRTPAQRLAAALQLNYHEVELHRFPDGESKVTLPLAAGAMTGQHVVLCRSLDQPNSKLIELMLAVATLRQQSTARISLVAPYLCYMRQDIAFHAGDRHHRHQNNRKDRRHHGDRSFHCCCDNPHLLCLLFLFAFSRFLLLRTGSFGDADEF